MKKSFRMLVVMTSVLAISACATGHQIRGVATPWGGVGVHSFAPVHSSSEPAAREVDAQVAELLDMHQVPAADTRMAAG